MERRDFLNNIGQLSVIVCAGSLVAACSKSSSSPSGGGTGTTLITADLNSQLTSIGSSITKNDVIVLRVADGNDATSFHALSLICTHQGCTINWDNSSDKFKCPCHGSEYDNTGSVLQGPATKSLKTYTVAVNGNTLTVS